MKKQKKIDYKKHGQQFAELGLLRDERLRVVRIERDMLRRKLDMLLARNLQRGAVDEFKGKLNLSGIQAPTIKPKVSRGSAEGTALCVMGDWHLGEKVLPAKVEYRNEYNARIEAASLPQMWRTFLFWIEKMRNVTTIPHCVLGFLGDLITGALRRDQWEASDLTALQQSRALYGYLKSGINFMLDRGKFKKVWVVCLCGNHGRDTEKPMTNQLTEHSYEWLIYDIIADVFKDDPRVEFVIANNYFVYQQVYDMTFRWSHGNMVSYQKGVGGVAVPLRRAIPRWNTMRPADFDFLAHYHFREGGNNYLLPGALVGCTPFGMQRGWPYDDPAQTFVLVDRKRSTIVSTNPVFPRVPYGRR